MQWFDAGSMWPNLIELNQNNTYFLNSLVHMNNLITCFINSTLFQSSNPTLTKCTTIFWITQKQKLWRPLFCVKIYTLLLGCQFRLWHHKRQKSVNASFLLYYWQSKKNTYLAVSSFPLPPCTAHPTLEGFHICMHIYYVDAHKEPSSGQL